MGDERLVVVLRLEPHQTPRGDKPRCESHHWEVRCVLARGHTDSHTGTSDGGSQFVWGVPQ